MHYINIIFAKYFIYKVKNNNKKKYIFSIEINQYIIFIFLLNYLNIMLNYLNIKIILRNIYYTYNSIQKYIFLKYNFLSYNKP